MLQRVKIVVRSMVFCAAILAMFSATPCSATELGRKLYLLGEQQATEQMGVLIESLEHSDPHIRRIAAHALGKLGCPEAVPYLIKLINYSDQPLIVRCVAVRSLARLGGPDACCVVRKLCAHENRFLRREANCAMKRYALRLEGKGEAGVRAK